MPMELEGCWEHPRQKCHRPLLFLLSIQHFSSINASYIVICVWTTSIVQKWLLFSIFFSISVAFRGEDLPDSSLSHSPRLIWGYGIFFFFWRWLLNFYYILKSENCKTVFIQTPEDCLTEHSIFTQTI